MAESDKTLDDFFARARAAAPPVKKSESRSWLEHFEAGGKNVSPSTIVKFLQKITPKRALISLSLAGLSIATLYYYSHFHQFAWNAVSQIATTSPAPNANGAPQGITNADTLSNPINTILLDTITSDPSIVKTNRIFSANDGKTLKLYLDSLYAPMNDDSLKNIASNLAANIDSFNSTMRGKANEDTSNEIMNSAAALANSVSIDSSVPGRPAIAINEKDVNEVSLDKGDNPNTIHLLRTTNARNGADTQQVALDIKLHENESEDDAAAADYFYYNNTLMFSINLSSGDFSIDSLTIDSTGSMTPEIVKGLYLEKEHLNAITLDTISIAGDPVHEKFLEIIDPWERPVQIHTIPLTTAQIPVACGIIARLATIKNMLGVIQVKSKVPIAWKMDTLGGASEYRIYVAASNGKVVVKFVNITNDEWGNTGESEQLLNANRTNQSRWFLGVMGGMNYNIHNALLTYTCGCSNLVKPTGIGDIFGLSAEYWFNGNGTTSLQFRLTYEQKPGSSSTNGIPEPYMDSTRIVYNFINVNTAIQYNLFNLEALFTYYMPFLPHIGIAAGPKFGVVTTTNYSESQTNSLGITQSVLPSGPLAGANTFLLGMKVGLQYEFMFNGFLISPAVSYDYGITKVIDSWTVNSYVFAVDVKYGL